MIFHKIGDKVIALKSSDKGSIQQHRVRGQVYEVLYTMYCNRCGEQSINIGTGYHSDQTMVSCDCGHQQSDLGRDWTDSKHFAKIDNIDDLISEYEKKEDYEFCGELMKIKQNINNGI